MKHILTHDALLNNDLEYSKVLEGLYHKGQSNIWDGKSVLSSLIEQHGESSLSKEKVESIKNIFSVIFWGEYAAWNISAELALKINSFEAKMAATSQAHDEARHFYVMRDYLSYIGCEPEPLPHNASKALNFVLNTNSLPKKLLGMQLMVEPIAITIFKLVIQSKIDPVLCSLLRLYEKDEARHIALGVKFLPELIKDMNHYEVLDLFVWQLRLMLIEVDGLKELKKDFENLGFSVDDVYNLAESKQLEAARLMGDELGLRHPPWNIMKNVVKFKKQIKLSDNLSPFNIINYF
tara:strand:+ start:1654 stop:2532 length:879 start_codon:yes stop_codon:yes gene_type:complete